MDSKHYRKMKIIILTIIIIAGIAYIPMKKRSHNDNEQIAKLYKTHPAFQTDSLTDLPLLHFPSKTGNSRFFVIMLPGDGGWRNLENAIANDIAAHGISVIGLNSSPYFKKTKQPRQVATDLQRIFNHFSPVFGKDSVALLGYSFTAEILPFVYNQMDSNFRSRVIKMVMLAPSNGADFKTSPIYHYDVSKSLPVLPEMAKIDASRFILICDHYSESISKDLPPANPYQTIKVNYGHLFLGHRKDIADIITNLLKKI
jgi:type IV secretory pathway VirJ component